MSVKNPLRGQERRVVSTKLYRSEFVNFKKICDAEGKKVNAMLRKMILGEIDSYPDKGIFAKKKSDLERSEEKLKQKFPIVINGEARDV